MKPQGTNLIEIGAKLYHLYSKNALQNVTGLIGPIVLTSMAWFFVYDDLLIIYHVITLRPKQNGNQFTDDNFNGVFVIENVWISIAISLKSNPKGPVDEKSAIVQVMAGSGTGDKPFLESMTTRFNDTYIRHQASML